MYGLDDKGYESFFGTGACRRHCIERGLGQSLSRRPAPSPGTCQALSSEWSPGAPSPQWTHREFVTADEAEIADDAWILGVVIDGQARAYSLNLLNRHEVVNDRINGKAFAAVW